MGMAQVPARTDRRLTPARSQCGNTLNEYEGVSGKKAD